MNPEKPDRRGFVLPWLLWAAALLSLLGAGLISAGRTETRLTGTARLSAAVRAAADGAVHEAIWRHATTGAAHWPAGAPPVQTAIGGIGVTVTIESLAGRVNSNRAPAALMGAVLARLGVSRDEAMFLGEAMFDWHMPGRFASGGGTKLRAYQSAGLSHAPPDQPFESDGEIASVLGMNESAAAALRPYFSIYNDGAIDLTLAAPPVRLAIEDTGTNQPAGQAGSETVEIVAVARAPGGHVFPRRAVVRFRPEEVAHILDWGEAGR